MTGDPQNEDEGAGQEPAEHHPTTGESEGANAFRPFRAWASANEPRESGWFRLRNKVASIFARKPGDPDGEEPGSQSDAEDRSIDVEETEEPSVASVDASMSADDEHAVAPPQNFRFPWTRSQVDAPAPVESLVDTAPDSFDFDAAFDAAPAPASEPMRSSGAVDRPFDSMDDALPLAEPDPAVGGDVSAPAPSDEPKRGLFSRFFGKPRIATEAAVEAESLEIEVHEDRIEAAAQALDDVGAEQFESFEGGASAPPRAFESVDDALPAMPPLDDLPIVGDFAPSAAPIAPSQPSAPPLAAAARVTAEVPVSEIIPPVPPVAASQRPTAEVPVPAIPSITDLDITPDAFEATSAEQVEEKTDEFEIAALEGPTDPMELESSTLEVPRKSFWSESFIARMFRRGDTQVETVGASEEEAAKASSAFLLAKFRAFYNEIIRFQHEKSEFAAGFATAILADLTVDVSPDASAELVSRRLSELLELQAAEAKWMGGEAAERYPDAQYAMAALADELFAHTEWDGQLAWPKFSLERKLHNSRDAEIELFRRMDRLLKEAPDSRVARDLARVYLLVLAAGFQGKWRPFGLTRPVAEYRRRLYEYVYGEDPLMLYSPDRRVFPEASSRTLEGHAVSRFTAMQRWTAVLALLVLTYTIVAHVAWTRVTDDLNDVTTRIQTGASTGAP